MYEEEYALVIRRLSKFYVGQRVLYSGRTNYSYADGKEMKYAVKNAKATIITKTKHNVVVQLDDYRQPYRTKSALKDMDAIEVIPPKQYAVITECDLACGDKHLEEIY